MEFVSLGLILIVVVGIAILAALVGGIFLLARKPVISSNFSELADLRHEVSRLHEQVERLREEVEQLRREPKAHGSTDIRSK
jgi:outer membrane murein-binding lipoprotein Lpp